MNGVNLLADTNTLIYLDAGNKNVAALLDSNFIHIASITEIELLGFPVLTSDNLKRLESMLQTIRTIEMSAAIKQRAILLRRTYRLKTPDAIIAATAMEYDFPLVTADKSFSRVKELHCILFEV